jgi:FeS assembly protein IscX
MKLKWTDVIDIAIELEEKHPEIEVEKVRFTDLQKQVLELENFDDIPSRCNEKILEAIQQAWLEERS